MDAQTSDSEKELKKVEEEAERLARNDFLDGNDLLYFYCQKYPIPALERDVADPEELTPEEAHFADQMWLIGRAYAASPERYSYGGKGKPKDDLLNEEGYESFFQDIARIMLRDECHQKNEPIAYFRGHRVDIKRSIEFLRSDEWIWTYLGNQKNMAEKLEGRAKVAAQDLSNRYDEQGVFAKIETRSLKLITACDEDDLANHFETDIESIKSSVECVSHFAAALNSARRLRDIACILKTLEVTKKNLLKLKKDGKIETLDGIPSETDVEKLFSSVSKKESWGKLPERANLVIQGEPAASISFASKFLHFHYPGLFFIFDSIASSKTRQVNPKLTKTFRGFECFRNKKNKKNKYKKQICEVLKCWEKKYESLEDNKGKAKEREYLKHALEELTFAYFFFDSLLKSKDLKSKDEKTACEQDEITACEQLVERLRSSNPECQSGCYAPAHHTYITRLVDILVMNSEAT